MLVFLPSVPEAERLARLACLHKQVPALRGRMMQAKAGYEAGQLTLDEDLAQAREIQRELATVGLQMHDLAAKAS